MPRSLTPAERVTRLRERHGSHDKLRNALRALGTQATRQRIIQWEKGAGISDAYRDALAKLDGSNPDDFLGAGRRAATQERGLRREVAELREEVEGLRLGVTALADAFSFVLTRSQGGGSALDAKVDDLLRLLRLAQERRGLEQNPGGGNGVAPVRDQPA